MRKMLVGVFVASLLLADAGSSMASVEKIDRCSGQGYLQCAIKRKVRDPRRVLMILRSRPPADL